MVIMCLFLNSQFEQLHFAGQSWVLDLRNSNLGYFDFGK